MLYETFSCPLVFLQTVLHFKHCSHFVCVLFCYNVSYLIIIYIFDVYDSLQLGMKKYSLSHSLTSFLSFSPTDGTMCVQTPVQGGRLRWHPWK